MKTLARQRDKAELLQRLRRVGPESAPRWGRMSAHQMMCHLSDALQMATGQKVVSLATSFRRRTIVKWIALYAPLPWPAGIPTSPEIDQELYGTKPVDFAVDAARVESMLDVVTTRPRDVDWAVHPVFGPMSAGAWLRWGYLHTDHHLRQFGA